MRVLLKMAVLINILLLTACGQSGPLTLPASHPIPKKVTLKPNAPLPSHMTGHVAGMPQQTNNNQL